MRAGYSRDIETYKHEQKQRKRERNKSCNKDTQ